MNEAQRNELSGAGKAGANLTELLYVFALTNKDVIRIARLYKKQPREVVYVNTPEKLRGLRGVTIIVDETAKFRDDYSKMIELALSREFKIEYI